MVRADFDIRSDLSFISDAGAVFVGKVWLGGRRNAVEEIRGPNELTKREQKHITKVSLGLEGSLNVAALKAGTGRETGKSMTLENGSTIKKSLKSLRVIGGDELLFEK